MADFESFAEVLAELRALPLAEQNAIIEQLSVSERAQLSAVEQEPLVDFRGNGLSPWLASIVDEAMAPGPYRFAPSTRRALAAHSDQRIQAASRKTDPNPRSSSFAQTPGDLRRTVSRAQ